MEKYQNREWVFYTPDNKKIEELSKTLGISYIEAKILDSKNFSKNKIEDYIVFLKTPKEQLFITDQLTKKEELEKGLKRLKKALETKEKILIHGDSDADGISGTCILISSLNFLGFKTQYDFPIRAVEGHGIQIRIIEEAKQQNIKLIITTDCGSKDIQAIEYANKNNIDIIVTDHHQILSSNTLPALAFINPYLIKEKTDAQLLAGAGVALQFMLALFKYLNTKIPSHLLNTLLIYSCFGTISDRVSIINPLNRLIIKVGVKALKETKKEGLKALKKICNDKKNDFSARALPRNIIPRLNAPGRIGNPHEGIPGSNIVVDLLLIGKGEKNKKKANAIIKNFEEVLNLNQLLKSKSSAIETAIDIDHINEKRKFITSKIEDEIDAIIQNNPEILKEKIIIIKGKNWNSGVIGIDCDRIKEQHFKPTVIITDTKNNILRGSVRSIPKINMYQILETINNKYFNEYKEELFSISIDTKKGEKKVNSFGGHNQACGFSLEKNKYNILIKLLKEETKKLKTEQFINTFYILQEVKPQEINTDLLKKIETLEPYGQHFDFPIFCLKNCKIININKFGNRYQTFKKPHAKLSIESKSNNETFTFNGVAFSLYEKISQIKNKSELHDIIFMLEKNNNKISLNIIDLQESH